MDRQIVTNLLNVISKEGNYMNFLLTIFNLQA